MQQETATIANHIPQIQLAAIHVFPAYFLNTKECDKSTLFRANVNISPVFYPIFFSGTLFIYTLSISDKCWMSASSHSLLIKKQ